MALVSVNIYCSDLSADIDLAYFELKFKVVDGGILSIVPARSCDIGIIFKIFVGECIAECGVCVPPHRSRQQLQLPDLAVESQELPPVV